MKTDTSVGYMISHTGRKLSQFVTQRFQNYDITSEQWTVLNRLTQNDGINQRELSLRTDKDPASVTRILDQLERKSFIQRAANPEDRRAFLIYATDEGKALDLKLAPLERHAISEVLSGLSEHELTTLNRVLIQINENLDKLR